MLQQGGRLEATPPGRVSSAPEQTGDRGPGLGADASGTVLPDLVALLGGFDLRAGGRSVALPLGSQRVVAFLALHQRPLQRAFVAGSLWSDARDERASANLRSALWRLRAAGREIVESSNGRLRLSDAVTVDIVALTEASRRLADDPRTNLAGLIERFDAELLPDWYDDWVVEWRERWRQVRLHSLEQLMRLLCSTGRYAEAIEAGLAAVQTEPLRESAHRGLIEVHLLEGNVGEAQRQYRWYERLLRDELGLSPSSRIRDLVGSASHR